MRLLNDSDFSTIFEAFNTSSSSVTKSPGSYNGTGLNQNLFGSILACTEWLAPQHLLFQLANTCFCVSYLSPNGTYGILFTHAVLILGFLLFSTWAWNIICAPDVFSWNFSFMIINMFQMLYILYQMRPVRFAKELEDVYQNVFQPLQVSRQLFKKLVSMEYSQMLSLHTGEAYAMQNLTRTDRLGLLVSGKVNVMTDNHFLHHIYSKQFLDSPEFESSRAGVEDKFKVTIIAATPCRYVFWQRESLEYLFVKEAYLAHIMSILIARDVTTKLYAMNEKIVTEKGSHLDIRLPSITSSIASCGGTQDGQELRSPSRILRASKANSQCNSVQHRSHSQSLATNSPIVGDRVTDGPDSVFGSREKLFPELPYDEEIKMEDDELMHNRLNGICTASFKISSDSSTHSRSSSSSSDSVITPLKKNTIG